MSDTEASCPSDEFFGDLVNAFVGDMSFHRFASIVAGACTAISIILCFGLCFMHLFTYRNRSEQRQIARIVLTPAIISFVDFLGIVAYPASGFLKPLGEYYDAIALVALYLLFLNYATPPEQRGSPRDLYQRMPELYSQHGYQNIKRNELGQYYRTWFFVFQVIPVRFALMLASMIVYGTVCKQLEDNNRANTVVTALTTVSTILCFLAVIRMMKFIKISLVGKHPIMKTVALKGLIAFAVTFDLVYSILKTAGVIDGATSTMSKKDWYVGLPNMIICCAGLIFSILIVLPFSTSPYTAKAMPGVEKHSVFRAFFDVINFTDILIIGLSCMPNAFSNWKRKPEEGTELNYYKDANASAGSGAPMMPPPAYNVAERV